MQKPILLALLTLCLFAPIPALAVNIGIPDVTVTSSATLIVANESGRVRLSCTNHDPTVDVRWAGPDVTATRGQKFPADRTIEIQGQSAIYMISEDTAVVVSCTKEIK